jgi:hypothetical protein
MALAYPNPAKDTMYFAVKQAGDGGVEIIITNIAGDAVARLRQDCPAGTGVLAWDCRAVASGVYLARVSCADGTKTFKIALSK